MVSDFEGVVSPQEEKTEAAKKVPSPVSTTATLEAGTNTQEQRSEERAKRLARFECVDCL